MFFESTIMGNTADLAMVQKTIIDTSTKTVSHRGSLLKGGGAVQGVLYQSILMQSWLEGRKWVGKCAQTTGWPQAWEYCQTKPIQTLGRASQGVNWSWSQCIKSHHAQTSSGKELPSHFWNRKHRQKHLTWAKEKKMDCWSVIQSPLFRWKYILHLIGKSRSQSLEDEWRETESM